MVAMTKRVKTFQVVFSDPSKTFYCGGDKVSGRVEVEVNELTRVSAVKVLGLGCAKVEYAKGKQRCRQESEYLRYEEVLRLDEQPTDTDGSVVLRPGNKYEYSFGFELPQQGQLVSSYKGKFGYVQYYVKAVMERPQQHPLECKKSFEVEEPLDVNTPDLLSPTGGMKEKKVTCMFIPDGQVSLNAKIDRRGFCEGEDICINAKFENTCSRIVVPKAAIIAKHMYQANGRTKVFRQKLSSVRGNHIISGMCDAWQGKTIRVPKLKPSMLSCNIIRVEYALMVSVHFKTIPVCTLFSIFLPMEVNVSVSFLLPDLHPHPRQREADPGAAPGDRDGRSRQPQQQRQQPRGFSQQLLAELGVSQDAVRTPQLLRHHPGLSPGPAAHAAAQRLRRRRQPHLHERPGLPLPPASRVHRGRGGVQRKCPHAAGLLKRSEDSFTLVQLSGTDCLKHLKQSTRSKLPRSKDGSEERRPVTSSPSPVFPPNARQVLDLKAESRGLVQRYISE